MEGKARTDEAYMALLMLAITGFHGLTMTPVWAQLTGALDSVLAMGRIVAFSAGMGIIMGLPMLIYAFCVWLSRALASSRAPDIIKRISYHDYFVRYAYCLLPIALFYHLAHNLEHLLMEGPKVFALMSDPFGRGWNLFCYRLHFYSAGRFAGCALGTAGDSGRGGACIQPVGGTEDQQA